MQSETTQAGIP